MINRLRKYSPQLSKEERKEGAEKRARIISDAQVMKRLSENGDFKRFCELLFEDRECLNNALIGEGLVIRDRDQRTRYIARINQIDKILNKPKSLIWQMENLTEVREAIKDRTRVRQAHGNKTGG